MAYLANDGKIRLQIHKPIPVLSTAFRRLKKSRIKRMSASLEFERFIGSNPISTGAVYLPDGIRYVFSAGGNVVIGDLIDPSAQSFLQR